jgi:CRISPR-associated protein Cmr6
MARSKKKQFFGRAAKRSKGSPQPSSQPRRGESEPAPSIPALSTPEASVTLQTPLFNSLLGMGQLVHHPLGISKRVPMEYRAQVPGRCQRQNINKPDDAPPGWRSDLQRWIDQWLERVDPDSPFTGKQLRIVEAQIDWRLISNSGVDEGVIRPVIGAGGWPMIPGSSIKGLFRRACPPDRLEHWCGSPCRADVLRPGILRFHGAWPANADWTNGLLDVAHPQQNWQVGFNHGRESHSAFGVVSLYQPRLQIGISCSNPEFSSKDWEEVELVMKLALQAGLGGRTCAGYGSSGRIHGDVLFQCGLEGQGPCAKLLDRSDEFRPTMFRAAIRGMALRLFGGLTDAGTTLQVVGELFGSLSREEGQHVGLLNTAYTDSVVHLEPYGRGSWRQTVYATSGLLQWRLSRSPGSTEAQQLLADLMAALHGLTMSLAGFGRGWRRPDHRIFLPEYNKTPLGCHWQWREPDKLPAWIDVQSAQDLVQLLQRSLKLATAWLNANKHRIGSPAPWRETLHPERLCIWTRTANGPTDAEVVAWFHHSPADREAPGEPSDPRDLKRTILAGKMYQVGLIWNRLLPLVERGQTPQSPAAAQSSSPMARSGGGALIHPAGAVTARPAATARPTARAGSGAAVARPPAPGRQQPAPQRQQGNASINAHQGAYLESLVLHPLPRNARPDERQHVERFIAAMNRGAGAGFQALEWS